MCVYSSEDDSKYELLKKKAMREQKKVTESAIELGNQRAQLQAQRWAFEEMKRELQLKDILQDRFVSYYFYIDILLDTLIILVLLAHLLLLYLNNLHLPLSLLKDHAKENLGGWVQLLPTINNNKNKTSLIRKQKKSSCFFFIFKREL